MSEREMFRQGLERRNYSLEETSPFSQKVVLWLCDQVASAGGFSLYPDLVVGRENIPDGPVVVAANHRGSIEGPMLLHTLGWMHLMVKKETKLRWVWQPAGMISVNREGDDRSALRIAIQRLKQGQIVGIFPEGTRGGNSEEELKKLNEFKQGAAYIAIRAGVPILPVAIIGTEKIMAQMDRKGFNFLKERREIISANPRPKIKIAIGRPIWGSTDLGITDREKITKLTEDSFETISKLIAFLERK